MLVRVIGWLLIIEAAFMLIPLTISIINEENDTFSFIITILITGLFGLLSTSIKPKSRDMGKREAILLTASIWVVFSIFGMLPFLFYGSHESITDAFFETMSGFTTTGATLFTAAKDLPKGIILWRCVIQWIGGMGIILFTLAVLPMLNHQGGIQLFNAEVTGITHDKLRPRVSSTAKGLWIVYIILTFILMLLLMMSDMSAFESVCHALSTVSTGGFATTDMSLTNWDSLYIKIITCLFMFLGGVNFALLYKTFTGQIRGVLKNDGLKWYLYTILISYIFITLNLILSNQVNSIQDITIKPIYQTISILSSTGITQPDAIKWGSLSLCAILIMMFIGACAGSTAGGAKIDRIIVVLRFVKNEFYKMMHPNTVTTVRINGNGTPTAILHKSLAFLYIYILVILFGGILLTMTGLPLEQSFFYSLSSVSNSGLNGDIIGFNETYDILPNSAKWILSSIMLIGRLELFTILLLFTNDFWKK